MLTKEGVSSFYKGSGFALFRAFVNTSISMSLYKPILNMIYKENSNKQTPLYPKIISASISGALTQLIACPVDVIKVRLQADGHLLKPRYKKTIDPLIKIFRHGILKFWTGLLPSIQRSTISAGCTISTYSHSKQLLINKLNYADNLLCHVISSFISGFVASLFSCPFDVIKTNIQFQSMSKPKYTNIFQCIRYITRREGVRGIFKGFLPIYYRLGPWQLIFFCTYEQLSKICTGDYF
ncbi:hypothetical protein MHBO_003265 [Bonamia ostreae]|uniref:Mitochondrial carrier protein n=1 Tax=Bonamia ostreae TaxID=126728 RepID=A0ABV2APY4_9EUKA